MKFRLTFFLILFILTTFVTPAQKKTKGDKEEAKRLKTEQDDSISLNKNIIYTVKPFELKLEEPAVGVQFYKEGYIFLLDTKEQNKNIDASFGILDTYYKPFDKAKETKASYFSPDFAFPYPTESLTFAADYNTMYFTKTAKPLNSRNPIKIFESQSVQTKKGISWSKKFIELPFNGKDYSCLEPTITEDGNLMIFASDMPGGFGKYDLYAVIKKGNSWGIPVNLGSKINTEGNENYPCLTASGILYFASDGHKGYGGYDIYYSKLTDEKWSLPLNLGQGINSSGNDIAFKQSKENLELAFFSSNRNYYKNRYQLFTANLKSGKEDLSGGKLITSSNFPTGREKSSETKSKTIIKNSETKVSANTVSDIVFRVQLLSSSTPTKQTTQAIGNRSYDIFEYYYKGSYRQTIGNYTSSTDALKLAEECRKKGFKDAFVVALQGKIRILDRNVFKAKKQTIRVAANVSQKEINNLPQVEPEQIIYRVQIASSSKPLGSFKVVINGKNYLTFEYRYKGIYRYTIGNFTQINKARELQQKCRNTRYNQAFIVKFKGNSRL